MTTDVSHGVVQQAISQALAGPTPDFLSQFNTLKMQESKPPSKVDPLPVNIQQSLPNVAQDCCPNQFVRRRSPDGLLTLNNKPYFFVGTNMFPLTRREAFGDVNKIRDLLLGLKAAGLNVVRIWCVVAVWIRKFVLQVTLIHFQGVL